MHLLKNCVETICTLVNDVCSDFRESSTSVDHCENKISQVGHRELESLAKSLLLCFESEERPDLLKPWESCNQDTGGEEEKEKSNSRWTGYKRNKGVPKRVYELPEASPAVSSEVCTPSRIQWV